MAVKSKEGYSIESESFDKYKDWMSEDIFKSMRKAAVLIGLFEKKGKWYFPLIKRPMHEKNHPGQIALPGGAMEKNETLEQTAIREAYEEVGIIPAKAKILGKLSPLPVPVSNYLIYPYVSEIESEPEWKINNQEVEELIILDLEELIHSDINYSENWKLRTENVKVPIFKLMNITIWGATAMVLSEFLDLIKE